MTDHPVPADPPSPLTAEELAAWFERLRSAHIKLEEFNDATLDHWNKRQAGALGEADAKYAEPIRTVAAEIIHAYQTTIGDLVVKAYLAGKGLRFADEAASPAPAGLDVERHQLADNLLDAVEAVLDPSLVRHADRRARALASLRLAYDDVVEEANR
jgi:hypothetical protein